MIVGLTGGSGSGKSSACPFFEKKGFKIVDMDALSRKTSKKGSPCLKEIESVFGSGVIDENGELKRRALGDIVFSDAEKLKKLNSITHKYIIEETEKIIAQNSEKDILFDAPLLFEAGLNKLCGVTLAVLSSKENRVKRICLRDNLTESRALARIESQPSDEFYTSHCDFVISNNGTLEELETALKERFGG